MRNLLNSITETYYKISKTDWDKALRIVDDKQSIIKSQDEIIMKQLEELETLRKYKANDDLLYMYEQENRQLRKDKRDLENGISEATSKIEETVKKVHSSKLLESTYLQKIIQLKNTQYTKQAKCPELETVGSDFETIYA